MFVATAYPGTEMFKHPEVVKQLHKNFGINFTSELEPILDQNYKRYVLELDDATKLLKNSDGDIINYGDIPDEQFSEIRDLIEKKEISKILDL